jgi:hypothetical protein
MEYCEICEKEFKVINKNHTMSFKHIKGLRHLESALNQWYGILCVNPTNDKLISIYLNNRKLYLDEVKKIQNYGEIYKSRFS